MDTRGNMTLIVGAVVLALIIVSCTFLVAYGKLDATLFMGVVIGPTVGGVVGLVAQTKGTQQGAQAAQAPPAPGG